MGFTYREVKDLKDDYEFEYGVLVDKTTRFEIYLVIYLLHIPIFLVARIPIFIIYQFLTCCCDKHSTTAEEDLKYRLLSYKYVDAWTESLNGFRDHPVGRQELAYNRGLNYVR